MSAQPLSEVQQKEPRDHTLQGAHSEHPTFTCSKVGRGVFQPPKRRKASGAGQWHSLVLAEWAEEGAGKNGVYPLSFS